VILYNIGTKKYLTRMKKMKKKEIPSLQKILHKVTSKRRIWKVKSLGIKNFE